MKVLFHNGKFGNARPDCFMGASASIFLSSATLDSLRYAYRFRTYSDIATSS